MANNNLVVELFVEELPPKALKKLGEAFAGVLFEQLKSQGLAGEGSQLTSFASPRRLAAHVTNVAAQAGADNRRGVRTPTHAAFFSSCASTSDAHAFGAIGKPSRARLSR